MTAEPDLGSFPVGVIAYCLDVTPRRVQQLAAESVIPKPARGAYPLAGAVRGYIAFQQQQIERAPTTPDERAAKARKTEAEAGLAEIELAKARGQVADIDVIADAYARDLAVVRDRLAAIPGRLADTLGAVERAAVADGINDALEDLHCAEDVIAAAIPSRPATTDGEGGPEAEAAHKSGGMGRAVPGRRTGKIGKPRKVADTGSARGVRSDARRH